MTRPNEPGLRFTPGNTFSFSRLDIPHPLPLYLDFSRTSPSVFLTLSHLDLSAPEGRRARLAFLAVEGAFMLRYFRLMDIGQEEWDSMLDDVRALLLTPAGASGD